MIGFFSLFNENQNFVDKKQISFVSIPDCLSTEEIRQRFSREAVNFANLMDSNVVYLNYGKDGSIRYDYSI